MEWIPLPMEWILLPLFALTLMGIVVLIWQMIRLIGSRVDCFEQILQKIIEIQRSDHSVLLELSRTQQRLAETTERLVETQGLQTSLLRAMDQQTILQLAQAARDSYERLTAVDLERQEIQAVADARCEIVRDRIRAGSDTGEATP